MSITIGSYYKTTIPNTFTASNNFRINFDFVSYWGQVNNIAGIQYDSASDTLYYINSNGVKVASCFSGQVIYYKVSSIVGLIPSAFENITVDYDSGVFTLTTDFVGVTSSVPPNIVIGNTIPQCSVTLSSGYSWYNAFVQVTMDGIDITSIAWDSTNHTLFDNTLTISGNVVIKITAQKLISYSVSHSEGSHTTFAGASSVFYGNSYTATLTATSGYYINNIIVTNNGIDVTDTAVTFNTNRSTATITLTCNGNIVITSTDISIPSVTVNISGVSVTPAPPSVINYNDPITLTFSLLSSSYSWDNEEVIIVMGGIDITSSVWNDTTKVMTITNVTGDLSITVKATSKKAYYVCDNTGMTLYANTEIAAPVTTIKLTLSGNTRTLKLNNTTLTWTSTIPSGKKLIGLSIAANSDRLFIGVDFEGAVLLNGKTFYEVIVDESSLPSGFTLNIYKNSSDENAVNKTITSVGTLTGTLREACNIINPLINIELASVPNFNYVYIPQWKRYYFVNDIISVRTGLWAVSLKIDVLMTYKDLIYSQVGFIARQENDYNDDLVDDERVVKRQPEVLIQDFTQSDFSNEIMYDNGDSPRLLTDLEYIVTVVRKD